VNEEDMKIVEDIIKIAQTLTKKVDVLCQRGACSLCPLDNIRNCNDYIQLSNTKYDKEMNRYHCFTEEEMNKC